MCCHIEGISDQLHKCLLSDSSVVLFINWSFNETDNVHIT